MPGPAHWLCDTLKSRNLVSATRKGDKRFAITLSGRAKLGPGSLARYPLDFGARMFNRAYSVPDMCNRLFEGCLGKGGCVARGVLKQGTRLRLRLSTKMFDRAFVSVCVMCGPPAPVASTACGHADPAKDSTTGRTEIRRDITRRSAGTGSQEGFQLCYFPLCLGCLRWLDVYMITKSSGGKSGRRSSEAEAPDVQRTNRRP